VKSYFRWMLAKQSDQLFQTSCKDQQSTKSPRGYGNQIASLTFFSQQAIASLITNLRTHNVTKKLKKHISNPRARFSSIHSTGRASAPRERRGAEKKGKEREALPPRRRRPADVGATAQSERLQDTFFTCQSLDQPLRSSGGEDNKRVRWIALPQSFKGDDGLFTIGVVPAVVLPDDQAGRPPLAEPVGGAHGVPVGAVPDEPAPPVRDPPQRSSPNHA
jgi:hypothetical protein